MCLCLCRLCHQLQFNIIDTLQILPWHPVLPTRAVLLSPVSSNPLFSVHQAKCITCVAHRSDDLVSAWNVRYFPLLECILNVQELYRSSSVVTGDGRAIICRSAVRGWRALYRMHMFSRQAFRIYIASECILTTGPCVFSRFCDDADRVYLSVAILNRLRPGRGVYVLAKLLSYTIIEDLLPTNRRAMWWNGMVWCHNLCRRVIRLI